LFEGRLLVEQGYRTTALGVSEEIKHLPRAEPSRVVQFVFDLTREHPLPGEKLGEFARRLVESNDPSEIEKLKAEITRGYCGD